MTADADLVVVGERLAAAATKGPWEIHRGCVWSSPQVGDRTTGGPKIARVYDHTDADFIAWAKEGVPALCAEVRRLRERLSVVEAERDVFGFAAEKDAAAIRALRAERDAAYEVGDALADAAYELMKAALVVKPTLDQPYPDDERWSPWTRWVERPDRATHDTVMEWRRLRSGETGA